MNIINLRKTLLSAVIIASPVFVQAIDYTYVTNGSAITITGYTGTVSDITIPNTISDLPVITIGQSAFSGSTITSVDIPTSVTNIEPFAFEGCDSLTSISIPNSVVQVGTGTFYQCTGLSSVDLPRDLETLETGLFARCFSLGSISIPSKVGVIEYAAFGDCVSLTDMVLPNSVTDVQQDAFRGCASLESISIGTGLQTFDLISGDLLFIHGKPLLPGCTNLAMYTVNKHNSYFSSDEGVLLNKDQSELLMCPVGKFGNYILPASVTNISESAFYGCAGLTNIVLPDGLISIDQAAFMRCSGITNMIIPSTVSFIGPAAFFACSSIESITIPYGITDLSPDLFVGCSDLINVDIPNSVTNISSAFANCSSLTNIIIPASVTHIGVTAFSECANLSSVLFEGNAPIIGDGSPNNSESLFWGSPNVVCFYLPETTGWGATFGERPTVLWHAQVDTNESDFSIHTNGFNFSITGPTNLPIVVEASASLGDPMWVSLQNALLTNGSFFFRDDQWTNYPTRFYRVRAP